MNTMVLVNDEGNPINSTYPLPVTAGVGVGATDLGKAEDAAHASGNVGVMALAVRKDTAAALAGTDGDYIPIIVDASGRLHVAVGSIPGIVGTVADDATTPGNPVMIGGKAVETDGTDPGSVSAEDDVAISRTDRNRRLLVSDVHPRLGTANTTETSAQTDKQLVAAPSAGLSIYVTDIVVSNGATAGDILFEEDTASAKTVKIPKLYLAINGGAVLNFRQPIRITAAKNFGFTSATVTTHTVLVNYYVAP